MKKHDEGYALVLVLVVVTVLCLVAMSMMAASLKNLTNQQASIERMEAKYQAEGEIEKVLSHIFAPTGGVTFTLSENVLNQACADAKGENDEQIVTVSGLKYEKAEDDPNKEKDYISFTLRTYETNAEEGDVKISCTIHVTGDIVESTQDLTKLYSVKNCRWSYESYTMEREVANDGN